MRKGVGIYDVPPMKGGCGLQDVVYRLYKFTTRNRDEDVGDRLFPGLIAPN